MLAAFNERSLDPAPGNPVAALDQLLGLADRLRPVTGFGEYLDHPWGSSSLRGIAGLGHDGAARERDRRLLRLADAAPSPTPSAFATCQGADAIGISLAIELGLCALSLDVGPWDVPGLVAAQGGRTLDVPNCARLEHLRVHEQILTRVATPAQRLVLLDALKGAPVYKPATEYKRHVKGSTDAARREAALRFESQYRKCPAVDLTDDAWIQNLERGVLALALQGDPSVTVVPHGAGFHLFHDFHEVIGYDHPSGDEITTIRVEVTSPYVIHSHPRRL